MKLIRFIVISLLLTITVRGEASSNPNLDAANRFAASGQYNEALQSINAAIAENPLGPRAYKIRAHVYYAMGDYARSLNDADQVVALASTSALPYVERAIIHSVMGNHQLALTDVDHALRINPTSEYAKEVRREVVDRAKKR